MTTARMATIALLVMGCGGAAPEAKAPEAENTSTAPPPDRNRGPTPQVSQELGSIDERATEKVFGKLQDKLMGCHRAGLGHLEYLAGDVKFFMRVGGDGRVRYAFLEDTTLGDRETEKCMLDAISSSDWPKPVGGEAEVRKGFGFSHGDVRDPTPWTQDKVAEALGKADEVKKCVAGTQGHFKVTAYVVHDDTPPAAPAGHNGKGKNGKKGPKTQAGRKAPGAAKDPVLEGKVLAVGVAPPNKEAAQKVDCLVDALKAVRLPSPGSYAAKVTFQL